MSEPFMQKKQIQSNFQIKWNLFFDIFSHKFVQNSLHKLFCFFHLFKFTLEEQEFYKTEKTPLAPLNLWESLNLGEREREGKREINCESDWLKRNVQKWSLFWKTKGLTLVF